MNRIALCVVVAAAAAGLAAARDVADLECVPLDCPFMTRVQGSALKQGDNAITIAPGKVTLRGVDLATGRIAGGWKAQDISVSKIIVTSSGSWSQKAFAYPEGPEELEDTQSLETYDGTPIEHIDICYHFHLLLQKCAVPCYERHFEWAISVSTPVTEVVELSRGQPYKAPFKYEMSRESSLENYLLTGSIYIKNPDPVNPVEIVEIRDVYDKKLLDVVCPQPLPLVLGPGKDIICEYAQEVMPCTPPLPGCEFPPTTNFVEVVVKEGSVVGPSQFSLDFEWKMCEEIDECVFEKDMADQVLNSNCDQTFVPYRDVKIPFESHDCGNFEVPFDAYVEGKDTNTKWPSPAGAKVLIHIDCPCVTGCVLSHGYWKTHGKASGMYDDRWKNILPQGESTLFFSTGKTYMQTISSADQLASQYIAAKLNILAGASVTVQVEKAVLFSEAFFRGETAPSAEEKAAAADILDKYNNGALGEDLPPKCDEL